MSNMNSMNRQNSQNAQGSQSSQGGQGQSSQWMQGNLPEQMILNDMLSEEKQMVSLYSTAITESGCPNMRQTFQQNLNTCLTGQYNVFTQMKNQGFYQPKNAQPNEVQQAVQTSTQTKSQL